MLIRQKSNQPCYSTPDSNFNCREIHVHCVWKGLSECSLVKWLIRVALQGDDSPVLLQKSRQGGIFYRLQLRVTQQHQHHPHPLQAHKKHQSTLNSLGAHPLHWRPCWHQARTKASTKVGRRLNPQNPPLGPSPPFRVLLSRGSESCFFWGLRGVVVIQASRWPSKQSDFRCTLQTEG